MEENQKEKTIISEHNCYESRFGIIHKRQFKLTLDGQNLSGSDELIYSGFKNKKTPIIYKLKTTIYVMNNFLNTINM